MRSWKDIKFYHGYSYNDIKNTQKQWKEMEKKYNPVKRIRRTCIKILFIVLIIAICGFLLIHAESELDSLHETYSSLDGTENTNSKYSFKKSLEFVYKLAGKEVPISLHTDLGGKPVVDWEDIAPGEDDSTLDGGESEEGSGTEDEVLELSPDGQKVKQALEAHPDYRKKADALAFIYDACMRKYNDVNIAIGYMANCFKEGNYGIVQYGMTVPDWDGPGRAKKSTGTNPLIVSTSNNIKAVEARSTIKGNVIGFGIVQWTFYTRVEGLVRHYKANAGADGNLSREELIKAENAWFEEELNAYTKDVLEANGPYEKGSYKAVTYGVCVEYESPNDKYNKAVQRAESATILADLLKSIK